LIRLFKWILILSVIIGLGTAIWTGFALWTGLYSVYSFPPSDEHPDGATLVIEREDGEPVFNSPDYIAPPRKKTPNKKGGVGFGKVEFRSMKPVSIRTVFTLPYVEYAYRKSLNEKQIELYEKGKLKQKTGGTKRSPARP
jgi:hypothetical protein